MCRVPQSSLEYYKMSESAKNPEFEPPQASVNRIVKQVLPLNVQLTKDARAAFTRAAGVFVFYLTHCANEFSKEGKRQTIYSSDIKKALAELDFEDLEKPFEDFMEVYSKAQKEESALRKAKKTQKETQPSSISAALDADAKGDEEVEEAEADIGDYESKMETE